MKPCKNCLTQTKNAIYCSKKCSFEFIVKSRIELILSTGIYPSNPWTTRRYLAIINGWVCAICGIKEWVGVPVALIMDHIDGDSTNWYSNNLRLICPNCDAQLPTFKGRNRGKGRFTRAQRYRDGLSH